MLENYLWVFDNIPEKKGGFETKTLSNKVILDLKSIDPIGEMEKDLKNSWEKKRKKKEEIILISN